MEPITTYWDYALIFLLLGVVVPLMGRIRVQRILRGPDPTRSDRLRLYASTIMFQWVFVALILWRTRVHELGPTEFGFGAPRPLLTLTVSAALVAVVLVNQLVSLRQLGARPDDLRSNLAQVALRIFPRDNVERVCFFFVVTAVAICEELIYRGFVQAYFTRLSGLSTVGVVGSAIMFGWAHLYQGKRGVIATCIVGLFFSAIRAATGSLIPMIVAHFAMDFIAGYFFPARLRAVLVSVPAVAGAPTN